MSQLAAKQCSDFRRALFHHESDSPAQMAHARTVLQLLLAQDGSTTRLCESVTASAVAVHVFAQDVVSALPATLQDALPGASFIRRMSSLVANGEVLLDSLSFIALVDLSTDIQRDLEQGVMPIGHMLSRLWTRREFRSQDGTLFEQLWETTGLPDPAASRCYTLVTPEGSRMVIGETFRRGFLAASLAPHRGLK